MPGPVPRPRPPRLQSITTPHATTFNPRKSKPTAKPTPPVAAAPAATCCDAPIISEEDDEGPRTCYNCGKVLSSESRIVAEVTFGETSAGAAVVQGGFVGENQRHANTMGGTMRGMGGSTSREQTEWKGKSEIQKLCGVLNLRLNIEEQAFSLYKLALVHNFVQGRRIRNVAAVCIYLAARRQPENTLLLMDLSEKIQVNIWTLGDNYKQFLRTIMMEDPELMQGHKTVQQIEPLMLKFCRKLEFEDASHRVAEDACKILRRMSRDWMVQGRQPAGLCGACIILAARMNNFRRTVREVVYVVKVADSTINNRLYEFKRLKTAKMTVQDFRTLGHLVKVEILPPAVWRREEKEERKRKRIEGSQGDEDSAEEPETELEPNAEATTTRKRRKGAGDNVVPVNNASPSGEPRRDDDGFVIPELPAGVEGEDDDNELDDELDQLAEAVENPEDHEEFQPPPQEDLDIEADLEEEVGGSLRAWDSIFKDFHVNSEHPILVAAGRRAETLAETYRPNANISNAADVEEEEFVDDEDVMNCLNTPDEIRIKERVWVTENEDWLREQQKKALTTALEKAQGKEKKPKTRRKHRTMGDGTLLADQPASNTAEAVQIMLQERAKGTKFSAHVNYEALKNMYGDSAAPTPVSSAATPVGASPAGSGTSQQRQQQAAPAPVVQLTPQEELQFGDEDAEGEYEEDGNEYPQGEEDYDDEHQYMDDPNEDDYNYDEDY
ncbi:hypothetical protein B0J11DRAFT_421126 [Dendryphion nanum]|uniref:Cyclin-like domain-containing protein n=1 Tax=Dendryphion nanum TaxID=256645 RepID=A0A9P9IYW2_9PLEO|nr:hypothetical protein B0J11DRAFT_421126 [Dendryphion nanum]